MHPRRAGTRLCGIDSVQLLDNLWQNRHNPVMKHRLPIVYATSLLLAACCAQAEIGDFGAIAHAQPAPNALNNSPGNAPPQVPGNAPPHVPGNALGNSPANPSPEGDLPGQPLVAESARQLLLQPALEARLRQRLWLYGHQFLGSGLYRQLGPGRNKFLQWDLKMEVNGQVTSLRQTSDRRHLWIHRNFPGQNQLSLIDLRRVEQAQAHATGPPLPQVSLGAFGGLPALLAGLDHYFLFPVAHPDRLGDLDVWVVEGAWKPERLLELLPAHEEALRAGNLPPLESLPPHLPHHAVLVLGRDPVLPLFPYRIEFLRQTKPAQPGEGPPQVAANGPDRPPGQGSPARWEPLLRMEFFEIRRVQLSPEQFIYDPGDNQVVDETDVFLERLGLKPAPSPAQAR
jgi:hypothetical protein